MQANCAGLPKRQEPLHPKRDLGRDGQIKAYLALMGVESS